MLEGRFYNKRYLSEVWRRAGRGGAGGGILFLGCDSGNPSFRFRSISCERISSIIPKFAYSMTFTGSRLGLLRVHSGQFITRLWPPVDVRISLLLKYFVNQSMEFDQVLHSH